MAVNSGERPRGEGGGISGGGMSWAQRLGSSLPQSLNKNILEVVLEKDAKGAFMVTEKDCAKLMGKLGLDLHPGVQVEGVQLCPNGRGVILITLKEGINIDSFCRYDVIQVNESGIRSTLVKPAGKREVVITVKGIHPNTKDSVVLDYLGKFGKIVTTKVVHGVFRDGPLKNMKNGDRAYKIEIKPGENVGSYHFIDGHKVSLRYAGQQPTCGRCHEVPQKCKGKGIAKRCEAEGGYRVEFSEYISKLWRKIGYSPTNDDLENVEDEEDIDVEEVTQFTPVKVLEDREKYAGVSIRQFPKETDPSEIIEFVCKAGLPEEKKDEITIRSNGVVTIKNIDNETSNILIDSIHGKVNFGKKIFCNGFIPITPKKDEVAPDTHVSSPPPSGQPLEGTVRRSGSPPPTASGSPVRASGMSTETHSLPDTNAKILSQEHSNRALASPGSLARRHSISLIDRTPPKESLAAEFYNLQTPSFIRTTSLLNELKSVTEQLSEFGSCLSSSSSSDFDDRLEVTGGFQTTNEKKRNKKKKRKLKITPEKEQFLKKPNLVNQ